MAKARASVFVCGVPRAGTSLLCWLIARTGVVGRPAEWFWRDDLRANAAEWGVTTFEEYLDVALERGTTPNGVVASKLMWGYLDSFLFQLRALTGRYEDDDLAVIESVFPQPSFLWLRREDFVAQAVSWVRATQTGEWSDDHEPEREPELDLHEIDNLAHLVRVWNGEWRRWFEHHGIRPLELSYEALCADSDGELARVLSYLHLRAVVPPADSRPEPRRQADELSAAWAARYREVADSLSLRVGG